MAGIAIAATVAAVTVLGLQNFQQSSAPSNNTWLSAASDDAAFMPSDFAAGPTYGTESAFPSEFLIPTDVSTDDEINEYLFGHMGYSSFNDVQRVLPYVQVVPHDNSR